MAGDFEQVLSKFRWANHQLAALDIAVADYVAQKPYVAAVEDKPEAQAYQVVARLRYPPPASIAHIAGDVLNSLHGTLDYLAWQLALREETAPDIRTSFPILRAPKKGSPDQGVNVFRSDEKGKGRVPLIEDPEVLALLDRVQPFHLPAAGRHLSPLQFLRTLNGESKHRVPAVLATGIHKGDYSYVTQRPFGADVGVNVLMQNGSFGPLEDGDELAWIPYGQVPEGGLPEHDDLAAFVAFEASPTYPRTGKPLSIVEALADAAIFINNEILAPFAPLFGFAPSD